MSVNWDWRGLKTLPLGFTSCYLIVMRVLLNWDQQIGHTLENKTEICKRQIFRDSMKSQTVSCLVVSDSLRPHGLEHARPPCPSPTPGVCPNSCPLSQWCHPTILSSVSPPSAINLSQLQDILQSVSSLHQVAKVLEFQLQHQSFQWTPRTYLL